MIAGRREARAARKSRAGAGRAPEGARTPRASSSRFLATIRARISGTVLIKCEKIIVARRISGVYRGDGARGGTRTRTSREGQRMLSPLRLPVSPPGHVESIVLGVRPQHHPLSSLQKGTDAFSLRFIGSGQHVLM